MVLVLGSILMRTTERFSREFGLNLSRYFLVHELRQEIASTHDLLNRYIRTREEELPPAFRAQLPLLFEMHRSLVRSGISDTLSLFEVRALAAGLAAYRGAATETLALFEQGDPRFIPLRDYATRVALYMDQYAQRLLRVQLDLGRQEYEETLMRLELVRTTSIVTFIMMTLGLLLFALFFSRSVTHPLEVLAAAARQISHGDLDVPPVDLPRSQELHDVAEAFNTMSAGIRTRVKDMQETHDLTVRLQQQELENISMERALRESQLVALQSQMNPHFLFNTLNSAARMAQTEHARGSEELIRGLALVLRYILRNPRRSVSVSEELTIAERYLQLQQVRFGNRLRVSITTDPAIESAQMPPLTLQPLVENAVIYGIEPRESGGTISIDARPDGTCCLELVVKDDGMGMDAETVERLLSSASDPGETGTRGIGVINVRTRLHLFFREEQSFSITSTVGEGTTVTIRIPMQRNAETYEIETTPRG